MKAQPARLRYSLRTMMVAMIAFALGFAARNIVMGVPPLALSLFWLPASTSPVVPGDVLLIECASDPSINRRVTVLADETIVVPHVGIVSVSSQDTAMIETTLATQYGKFYRAPTIQVFRARASEPLH